MTNGFLDPVIREAAERRRAELKREHEDHLAWLKGPPGPSLRVVALAVFAVETLLALALLALFCAIR
jgi:hypothetical protein